MATIVEHAKTRKRYVLLGTGFGSWKSSKPNWFFGDLIADVKQGQMAMVCVCDDQSRIGWLNSAEVSVVSVDGQSVKALLG